MFSVQLRAQTCDPGISTSQTWNIVTDFGADPLPGNDDHQAFIDAAAAINAIGGTVTLVIPQGEYTVGRQAPQGSCYLVGESPLHLVRCKNVVIQGEVSGDGVPLSVIKRVDCMQYGGFFPNGERRIPICDLSCITSDDGCQFFAGIGEMVLLQSCSNVHIKDVEVDGNLDGLIVGGKWGEIGIQGGGSGIFISGSGGVTIENCNIHDNAFDGITFATGATGFTCPTCVDPVFGTNYHENAHITVCNSQMNANARMGIDLGGGNGFKATNCDINYNGTGTLSTFPSSGVDIEYEGVDFFEVKHSRFEGCRIHYNKTWGVITDSQEEPEVEDHVFVNCSVIGSETGPAIKAVARGMKFYSCKIIGPIIGVYAMHDGEEITHPDHNTVFDGCVMMDSQPDGGGGVEGVTCLDPFSCGQYGFLLNAPSAAGMLVRNCVLNTSCYLWGMYVWGSSQNPVIFENSEWHYSGNSCYRFYGWWEGSSVNVVGSFQVYYPNDLAPPCDADWSDQISFELEPGVVPIPTGTPSTLNCFGTYANYTDPPATTIPRCYVGSYCAVMQGWVSEDCSGEAWCSDNAVEIELQTDAWGAQTTWAIRQSADGTVVCSGDGAVNNTPSSILRHCCLPDGCYRFEVYDSFGDGMCCTNGTGGYVLRTVDGRRIIDNSGDGQFSSTSSVNGSSDFCVPLGSTEICPQRCDILNLIKYSTVCAEEDPAVSAGDVLSNPQDYGYQFWFFDPDGPYSRLMPTNLGGAFTSFTGRYRQLNWQTQPIPPNKILNMRVASKVNGVVGPYGPACTFQVLSGCCTQLNDNPSDAWYSYGSAVCSGPGTSDKLYAYSLNNPCLASSYKFKFCTGPDSQANCTGPEYTSSGLALFMYMTNLAPGQYTVFVQTMVDGVWQGYCGIGTPVTILSCMGGSSGGEGSDEVGVDEDSANAYGDLSIYPNPTDGSSFFIALSNSGQEFRVGPAELDIFDAQGVNVISRRVVVPGDDSMINIQLDVPLSKGLYMVTLSAGDAIRTRRMVVAGN